jgi:hypothetical protein
MPIIVDIRFWDRPLFYAALPGSTGRTRNWARRKLNVVKMFHKSTYRMVLEEQRPDRTFKPGAGLEPGRLCAGRRRVSDPHQGRRRGRRASAFRACPSARTHRGGCEHLGVDRAKLCWNHLRRPTLGFLAPAKRGRGGPKGRRGGPLPP